jgi:hypothetical protein
VNAGALLIVAAVCARPASPGTIDDSQLIEAFNAARSNHAEFELLLGTYRGADVTPIVWGAYGRVLDGWDDFAGTLAAHRELEEATARATGTWAPCYTHETWDRHEAKLPYEIGRLIFDSLGRLRSAMGPGDLAAFLSTASAHFETFIERFRAGEYAGLGVDDALHDRAVNRWAAIMMTQASALDRLGRAEAAAATWARIERGTLRAIDEIIAGGLDANGEYGSRRLGQLTHQYLRAVRRVRGDRSYVEAAVASLPWLRHQRQGHSPARGSHAAVDEMARTARQWTGARFDDAHARMADALAGVVRAMHADVWDDAFADSVANVEAHLASIRVALRDRDPERADALLSALEGIDGLHPIHRTAIEPLRSSVDALLAAPANTGRVEAWLDGFMERFPPAEPVASAPRARGTRESPVVVRVPPPPARRATRPPAAAARGGNRAPTNRHWLVVVPLGMVVVFALCHLVRWRFVRRQVALRVPHSGQRPPSMPRRE